MPDTETDHGSLELAHEVNKELLDLLTYRSQRRFILSVGLLAVKVGVIGLLGAMAFRETPMQNGVENAFLILLTAIATTQSKLTQHWFGESDSQLLREATSYAMNDRKKNNG